MLEQGEHASHEALVQDLEGPGRALLFAQDQLGPGRILGTGHQHQHAFGESQQGRFGLAAQVRLVGPDRGLEQVTDGIDEGTETLPELTGDVLEHGQIEPFLAAEVVTDQGLVDLRFFGDGARRRRMEAVAAEHGHGGQDQGIAGQVAAIAVGDGRFHGGDSNLIKRLSQLINIPPPLQ